MQVVSLPSHGIYHPQSLSIRCQMCFYRFIKYSLRSSSSTLELLGFPNGSNSHCFQLVTVWLQQRDMKIEVYVILKTQVGTVIFFLLHLPDFLNNHLNLCCNLKNCFVFPFIWEHYVILILNCIFFPKHTLCVIFPLHLIN